MASVSDFIELAPGENVVKEYRSFRMKKPQNAIVNIAATNMRLILYGQSSRGRKSGRPTLTQEIRIEDIRGVEIYEKERPNLILVIIGLFFFASAVILALGRAPSVYGAVERIAGNGAYGTIACIVLGIVMIVLSLSFRNREFEILVKGKTSNLNTGMFAEKTVFKEGIDSPKILRELGSIIIQIQKERRETENKFRVMPNEHQITTEQETRREFGVEELTDQEEEVFEYEGITETEFEEKVNVESADREEVSDENDFDRPAGRTQTEKLLSGSREKVNVDDILETMQTIENPTNKKKDDFLF